MTLLQGALRREESDGEENKGKDCAQQKCRREDDLKAKRAERQKRDVIPGLRLVAQHQQENSVTNHADDQTDNREEFTIVLTSSYS